MYISSSEPDETESGTPHISAGLTCAFCDCCARGECKADGSTLCITPAGNGIMPWWECPCEITPRDRTVEARYGYVIVFDREDGSEPWITHGSLARPLSLGIATSLMNFRAAVLAQNNQPGTYSLRAVEVRLAPPAEDPNAQ